MRIISREVLTSHSREEVFQIIKDAASCRHSVKFCGDSFWIAFPIRWHTRNGVIPIKGTVTRRYDYTEVRIEIYSGLSFYLGLLFICVGLLFLVCGLLATFSWVRPMVISVVFGTLICIISLFDGIICLDSLEHRLTRSTADGSAGQKGQGDGS